jgi:hypothetical protein
LQQEKLKKASIFYIKNRDFACSGFYKFARIIQEMKKILCFIFATLVCIFNADAASRGENTASRSKNTNIVTTEKGARSTTSRNAVKTTVAPRNAKSVSILSSRTAKKTAATRTPVSRSATVQNKTVSARAAAATTQAATSAETRTGAEYEQCKSAFFTCMDQFCQLKNDSYRRCSCNDRIFELQDIADTYQKANEKLTEFSEDLDVVGMTREQALAMKTASEGEDAMTEDKSASKQLLQAIMNSIKGGDTSVGGKYKDLNSVTISADISNAFGMDDSGQIIASYNGATLYKAVYPKCRNAVKEDCNNASLQRAVNAYLMAIEQDCNTVESALKTQQKSLKASTHQSSAMLDLARVENRQNHNSDDVATCLANVEKAVQSEEVCGAGYHKCLDYGQFIDVATGAPLTGVADFYKLGELLTFKTNVDIKDQKLSSLQNNREFVQFFENKTKKFAKESLDKCVEDSDYVWQQYLDRALLDIYYAQQSKVKDIKQSCLTLVAQCYDNQNVSITNAMANLTGDSSLLLKPNAISLTTQMCDKYIDSCDGMFSGIIRDYIETKDNRDSLNACRAIAQQCFDKFGGEEYGNFYSTQNGLFARGAAIDWFSIYAYDYTTDNSGNIDTITPKTDEYGNKIIVSPCAQQLAETAGCADQIEEVFGGFDKYVDTENAAIYSAIDAADVTRQIRSNGIATEVYYKIIDGLSNHCNGLGGYFVEYKYAAQYGYQPNDLCRIASEDPDSIFYIDETANSARTLVYWYHFGRDENMCPANYNVAVDTQSWGLCSCWENGGYRSKNGSVATCRPIIPAISGNTDSSSEELCSEHNLCKETYAEGETVDKTCAQPRANKSFHWCQQTVVSSDGQLCPTMNLTTKNSAGEDTANSSGGTKFFCASEDEQHITTVNENVPKHSR